MLRPGDKGQESPYNGKRRGGCKMNFHKEILRASDPTKMNYEQKKEAAKDPNTSTETLEFLATDKDPDVRYWVAQNRNTPTKSLELLATDKNYYVRYWVARNSNTPPEALELLATDKDPDVRHWVAQNPNRNELIERLVFMTNYQQDQ